MWPRLNYEILTPSLSESYSAEHHPSHWRDELSNSELHQPSNVFSTVGKKIENTSQSSERLVFRAGEIDEINLKVKSWNKVKEWFSDDELLKLKESWWEPQSSVRYANIIGYA